MIFTLAVAAMTMAAPHAQAQKAAAELATYQKAVATFKAVLKQRRAQIDAGEPLPSLPGQALYKARIDVMSSYKDLTDADPSRIGRTNKFNVPPAYFDVAIEPLIEEYRTLLQTMQKPPSFAQASATPFKDVVDLGRIIARAKGADRATAEEAGMISLALFFAETNGIQNIGNARSNTYKGSLQTGTTEDRKGRQAWAQLRPRVAQIDAKIIARDDKEVARVGDGDQRYNHWTAVRNGLMNAHAGHFRQLPEIMRMVPDRIDQMKVFELIQIVPSPTRSALASGDVMSYRVSDPRIMGYLRNNSIFTFGKRDRSKTSATYREILDAMWLFEDKFKRALAAYDDVKASEKK